MKKYFVDPYFIYIILPFKENDFLMVFSIYYNKINTKDIKNSK